MCTYYAQCSVAHVFFLHIFTSSINFIKQPVLTLCVLYYIYISSYGMCYYDDYNYIDCLTTLWLMI